MTIAIANAFVEGGKADSNLAFFLN